MDTTPLNPNDTPNDQYRIQRQLGRGGFGFVYQAQDTLIHREVAIKELIPALAPIPGLLGDEAMLNWSSEGTSDAGQET